MKLDGVQGNSPNLPNLAPHHYRPDIDGLRALAVLAVLGFHFSPNWITGGFIGVDIFFVISGYLISSIIFQQLSQDNFSFTQFYSRRIKRIFPALILVFIVCIIAGWFTLFDYEYQKLGAHIAAGGGFVSNLVYWSEAGYFDNAAETKPLLHLWSLGIEEQFYIVWPFLIWFLWKRKWLTLLWILLICTVSFIWNLVEIKQHPVADFYSPLTRFWELLAGSILAYISLFKQQTMHGVERSLQEFVGRILPGKMSEQQHYLIPTVVSLLGLSMVFYGLVIINKDIGFPGIWAVFPVLGATLIIAAGPDAWFNRVILSNKLAVWIGLISYPLYLWHWPLLSFASIVSGGFPQKGIRLAILGLSFLLAWLTYRLIEKPLRHKRNNQKIALVLLLMMLATILAGGIIYMKDGFAWRKNASLVSMQGELDHRFFYQYIAGNSFPCVNKAMLGGAFNTFGYTRCFQSKNNDHVQVLLFGDSHAEHLYPGIAKALPDQNVAYYILSPGNPMETIKNAVDQSKAPKVLLINLHWSSLNDVIDNTHFRQLLDSLSAKNVKIYLLRDSPEFNFLPSQCVGKRWMFSENPQCQMPSSIWKKQKDSSDAHLESLMRTYPNIKLVDLGNFVCKGEQCDMTMNEKILMRDAHHFNVTGSIYMGDQIVQQIGADLSN